MIKEKTMFHGSIPALITPFRNGKVDETAFEKLIEFQIQNGSKGLVPVGTTGESPTVSYDEHKQIIELCVSIAKGRTPVIAGTGSNSTQEAIEFTEHAKKVGADAALVVSPYYNKPCQRGIKAHFLAIADAVDIPIFIYNIPSRSVIDITDETLAELSKHKNIAGIKDATGDLSRPAYLRTLAGPDFCLLSGEDPSTLPFRAAGGKGCISVVANVAPRLCADLHQAWDNKELDEALKIQQKLTKMSHAVFCTTSPGPVKYAAELLGICRAEVRLPVVQPSDEHKAFIRKTMQELKLI